MLYPSMPELLKNVDNRYLLVNVIADEARKLALKAEDMGEPLSKKPVSLAIDKIAEGDIVVKMERA